MLARYVPFETMKGLTLTAITGAKAGSGEIKFRASDGSAFMAFHSQDCCESVEVLEVVGDVADLIGSPILQAEEAVSEQVDPEEVKHLDPGSESFTWTFYKLATIKGSVTIRWYGESNGFYSESVDFVRLSQPEA